MSLFPKTKTVKLDFILVGTQKGGTSALDYYLGQHNDIVMSSRKEIHFFDRDAYFQNGSPDYSLISRYYPKFTEGKLYGEATPVYMFWPGCIPRIRSYNPDIKLIAILRDPVSRAFSHWNMESFRGKDSRSFKEAIREEMNQIRADTYKKHRVFSYLARGLYTPQVEQLFNHFPKEQLLFVKYEQFQKRQIEETAKVIQFLGLSERDYKFEQKEVNKFEYASTIKEDEIALLKAFFAHDIETLEQRLQWDCSDWK